MVITNYLGTPLVSIAVTESIVTDITMVVKYKEILFKKTFISYDRENVSYFQVFFYTG